MTRQEAQLALIGHLANEHGRKPAGKLDELTEMCAKYVYATTRHRRNHTFDVDPRRHP